MLGLVADTNSDEYDMAEARPGAPPTQAVLTASDSRPLNTMDEERTRLRDPLSFERQHPPSSEMDGPLMPPVPESRDYSVMVIEERRLADRIRELEQIRRDRSDLRRMARRHPAPTPPYAATDIGSVGLSRSGIDSPRPSSLAPALSPSHRVPAGDGEASPRRQPDDPDFSFTVHRSFAADVSYGFFHSCGLTFRL